MRTLLDTLGVALSGLRAAGARLAVTANNIANADTPGFKASRADGVELSAAAGVAGGGVGRASPAVPAAREETAGSDVDLAAESVDLVRERFLYAANAAVVRTADRMLGTLLDVVARHRSHDR